MQFLLLIERIRISNLRHDLFSFEFVVHIHFVVFQNRSDRVEYVLVMFRFHLNIFDNVVVVQHLNVRCLELMQVYHQYPKDISQVWNAFKMNERYTFRLCK